MSINGGAGLSEMGPLPRRESHRIGPLSASGQTSDSRETLESSIEAQDLANTVDLHDRQVHSVSRGQALPTQYDLPGSFDCCSVHWEDFIDDSKQSIERGLNSVRPHDGDITVKDFLQYFGISYQALSSGH